MYQGNPFDVSKRHQRGVWILIFLSTVIIFAPRVLQFFTDEKEGFELEIVPYVAEKTWHKKYRHFPQRNRFNKNRWFAKKAIVKHKPTKFFDPNELTKQEWMFFGLSEKQAEVVLKIAKRGIHSNQELQGIKFIPPEVFENIKEFTSYPTEAEGSKKMALKSERTNVTLDLNQVNEQELSEVKGIGPFFSKQILKYRSQLGGFSRKEQLKEVWKMTPELYVQIQAEFSCAATNLTLLHINSETAEKLQAHPYLNWNQANSIVKMRVQKGGYKSIDEIKESVIIDQETFEKVRPYLSL